MKFDYFSRDVGDKYKEVIRFSDGSYGDWKTYEFKSCGSISAEDVERYWEMLHGKEET